MACRLTRARLRCARPTIRASRPRSRGAAGAGCTEGGTGPHRADGRHVSGGGVDTIGRQVTAFVTLFMAASLIILMYLIFEPARRSAAADEQRHMSAERGAHLFAENC